MKWIQIILLVLVTIACFSSFAATMEPDATKLVLYNLEKKDPWIAVGGAFFVPSFGRAYAGNWGRGLAFAGAELIELSIATSVIMDNYYEYNSDNHFVVKRTENDYMAVIMMLTLLGTRIWEYVDAYKTAEKYNDKLQLQLGISRGLHSNVFAVSYRF